MIDVKEILERESERFHQEVGARERLSRRRDRKRRNQRISAAALALIIAAAAVGSFVAAYRLSSRPTPTNPNVIGPENVSTLGLAWSGDLMGSAPCQSTLGRCTPYPPTVAGDSVYVGTDVQRGSGKVYAFPASCAPSADGRCSPTWTATVRGGVVHPPTVVDGEVYVTTTSGKLYAFPTSCPETCAATSPGAWTGDIGRGFFASPVESNGMLYGVDAFDGTLYAFRDHASCSSVCAPAWTASLGPGVDSNLNCGQLSTCVVVAPTVVAGIVFASSDAGPGERLHAFDARTGDLLWKGAPFEQGPSRFRIPVVDGGRVFVADDRIAAYATNCGTGGATCAPLWTSLRSGTSQAVVAEGTVVFGGGNGVSAYAEDCGHTTNCAPAWHQAGGDTWSNRLVAGEGLVLVGSNGDDAVRAVPVTCGTGGASCTPSWTADVSKPGALALSGGLAYVGSDNGSVLAFATNCGTSPCAPSWKWTGGYGALSTPAVTSTTVYVLDGGGALMAFEPGAGSGLASVGGRRSEGATAVFYGIVAIGAITLLAMRRRRRRAI